MKVDSTHVTTGSPHTHVIQKYILRLKNLKRRLEICIVIFVHLKCT